VTLLSDDSEATDLRTADAVLAVIPASLLLSVVVALALPFSWGTALAAGSVPATGSIGYALFYDPPTARE